METIQREKMGVRIIRSSKRSLLIATLVSSMTGVSAFDSEMDITSKKPFEGLDGQSLGSTSLLEVKNNFFAFHNTGFIDVQESLKEINRQVLYSKNLHQLRRSYVEKNASEHLLPGLMVRFASQVREVKDNLTKLDIVNTDITTIDNGLSLYSGDTIFSESKSIVDDFVLKLSLNQDAMDVLKLYDLDSYKWIKSVGKEGVMLSSLQDNNIKGGR